MLKPLAITLAAAATLALTPTEPVDWPMVARIRGEGLQRFGRLRKAAALRRSIAIFRAVGDAAPSADGMSCLTEPLGSVLWAQPPTPTP